MMWHRVVNTHTHINICLVIFLFLFSPSIFQVATETSFWSQWDLLVLFIKCTHANAHPPHTTESPHRKTTLIPMVNKSIDCVWSFHYCCFFFYSYNDWIISTINFNIDISICSWLKGINNMNWMQMISFFLFVQCIQKCPSRVINIGNTCRAMNEILESFHVHAMQSVWF